MNPKGLSVSGPDVGGRRICPICDKPLYEDATVLPPGQRDRELEEALRLVMYYADNGWDTRSGFGEAICEARAALSVGEEERHED
jgi:hypothetical protein